MLHPKQLTALNSPATEILYGGAAGGGKSHLLRIAAIVFCAAIAGLQVYLFRRISDDLIRNHVEGPQGFHALLAPWIALNWVKIVEDEIRFWNGSKIYLRHCETEKDRFKYQGAEIHLLLIDELTHFTEVVYRFLRSRVRMAGIELPTQYEGMFPRVICGSNPGNIGHHWVKATFIDSRVPLDMWRAERSSGGMIRQFIPSRLNDNPSIDPDEYSGKLSGLGSPALVKAMLEGDWNVIAGAFFPEFSSEKHICEPFELPKHLTRFRAMDWGSASPTAVAWFAVASDELTSPDGVVIPRGALIQYREWYAAVSPNVGLKWDAERIAEGIRVRDGADTFQYSVLDPSAFKHDGGPSIAERMAAPPHKVNFQPADNTRSRGTGPIGGWDLLRSRLRGDDDGHPMIFWFNTCTESIRTLPALQHDEKKPEDADTDGDDHMPDAIRYGCSSRPWIKPSPTVMPPLSTLKDVTMNRMWKTMPRGGRRV